MLFTRLSLVALLLVIARSGAALTACTAAQVTVQDPSCPPAGTCTIDKTFSVPDGCTLDFTARPLILAASAELDVGSGTVSIHASSLIMNAGAFINGRGTGSTAPTNNGGTINIQTIGDLTLQKNGSTRSRIDVSANSQAGTVALQAGGAITVAGRIEANQLAANGTGGRISFDADGNVSTLAGSIIAATGGNQSPTGGGVLVVSSRADVSLGDNVDLGGSSGGQATISAAGDALLAGLSTSGNGDTGSGGVLTVNAGKSIHSTGSLLLRGSDYNVTSGGEGGLATLNAASGDLVVAGSISAEGAGPDADGGEITLDAAGTIDIQNTTVISARANGFYGGGGSITIATDLTLTSAGSIDASGGGSGGDIEIDARGDVVISGQIDDRGRYDEGFGGTVSIEAGSDAFGALTIADDIDVGGGACDIDGCGDAGMVDLRGCNLTVTPTGRVLGRAPMSGGFLQFIARELLRIDGTVNAAPNGPGDDGVVSLSFPTRKPPQLRIGGVSPAPQLGGLADCSVGVLTDCLVPCPSCGAANACMSTPTASPSAPAATATPTRTATSIPGAASATPTVSPAASATPTRTATRTITGTQTRTATPSMTRTPSVSPTASSTPASTFDAVVFAPRPLTLKLGADQSEATKLLFVRVGNGNSATAATTAATIRVVAADGSCPSGTIAGAIDADPLTAGVQDSIVLAPGRSALATIPLRVTAAGFTSQNKFSPARCTIAIAATALGIGNSDPTPDNNLVTIEINVIDAHDADPLLRHQSALDSLPPLRVSIGHDKTSVTRAVRVRAANADSLDIAGHAVTIIGSDGDCPTGTLGPVLFHRPNAVAINTTAIGNRHRRRGKLPITIRLSDFAAASAKAPARCTALLQAVGPSGDINDSNNVTALQIDVAAK